MPFSVRDAALADLPIIYEFVCELEEQVFDFEEFKNILSQNIQHLDRHYLVACNAQEAAIGYASLHAQKLLHHCGLVGEIQEMYVLPAYRSLGVGRLLLEKLKTIAQRDNYVLLEVTSNNRRTDTHRFYGQNGFVGTSTKFVMKIR